MADRTVRRRRDVATTTLRESDQPYRLLVELARGKLNQVRVQTAEWEGIGLRLPKGFQESLNEVTTEFARALLGPDVVGE